MTSGCQEFQVKVEVIAGERGKFPRGKNKPGETVEEIGAMNRPAIA